MSEGVARNNVMFFAVLRFLLIELSLSLRRRRHAWRRRSVTKNSKIPRHFLTNPLAAFPLVHPTEAGEHITFHHHPVWPHTTTTPWEFSIRLPDGSFGLELQRKGVAKNQSVKWKNVLLTMFDKIVAKCSRLRIRPSTSPMGGGIQDFPIRLVVGRRDR